jgi:hypothetical protein
MKTSKKSFIRNSSKEKSASKECKRFKELIVDALYNELTGADRQYFQSHMKACPSCVMEYEEMASVLGVMEQRRRPEMSEDFWDSFMPSIQEQIDMENARRNRWRRLLDKFQWEFNFRWILYPAAALLLVAAGISIGRYVYKPSGGIINTLTHSDNASVSKLTPVMSKHFDDLRPMLLDCANYSSEEGEGGSTGMVMVNKKMLKTLMHKNYLLKKMAENENNPALKQLLEELELILMELVNSETDSGKQSIRSAQTILSENDVLFKMKVFDSERKKRKYSL